MRSASLQVHLTFKLATALLAVAGSVVLLLALTRLISGDPATVILGRPKPLPPSMHASASTSRCSSRFSPFPATLFR